MPVIKIEKTGNSDDLWNLLLLADPSRELVEQYLPSSDVYTAVIDNQAVGVAVLYKHSEGLFEIKNLAVDPQHQGRGIGYKLLMHVTSLFATSSEAELRICTGNTSEYQIALYKKAGFEITSVEKDYFLKNYPEPIYENGDRCMDLVILSQVVGS